MINKVCLILIILFSFIRALDPRVFTTLGESDNSDNGNETRDAISDDGSDNGDEAGVDGMSDDSSDLEANIDQDEYDLMQEASHQLNDESSRILEECFQDSVSFLCCLSPLSL